MIKKGIAVLLLLAAIFWSYKALMPQKYTDLDADKSQFSTARALLHLEQISKSPHAIGTEAHADVRQYIIDQLIKLGMTPIIQEGYSITSWGNLTKSKNILARMEGTEPGKALMLMSHYDSSPHASYGASDAGSGVSTILEGLRAFLEADPEPKNDIIVLITDAEELGLNGAKLFVDEHEWADDVGLILNFEARGSGGPSYMLIETNGGNSRMMEEFVKANPDYPVGNSLAYSIYKMLPNDTDLTVFREDGNIDGFNFAFIDDHYDYHTALDTYERLDRETLEHQGSYMMPLLNHFANANLNNLKSNSDKIYFNVPGFKMITYPYGWIWPMLVLAFLIFIFLIVYGIQKSRLVKSDMLKGFLPFLLSLVVSAVVTQGLFMLFSAILYPGYAEILHGFPYNGHAYITAFTFITIGLSFLIYAKFHKPGNTVNLMVAPITFWLLLCILFALELKGASFFIVPVYFGLISFYVLIEQRKPSLILMALLCFPVLMIMSPFVKMFPVGLGLVILFVSAIITVLIFSMCITIFGFFKHKRRWAYILMIFGVIWLVTAHFKSDFNAERPLPNSLVYMLDADNSTAQWATYDNRLDEWTKQVLGEDPNQVMDEATNVLASKYNSGFTFYRQAEVKPLLYPEVEVFKDSVIEGLRHVSIYIEPKRAVDRIDFFADSQLLFKDFNINGLKVDRMDEEGYVFQNRNSSRLFTYFFADDEPLEMKFTVPEAQNSRIMMFESSNDLLDNRLFDIEPRPEDMIPKPFVLNDAVMIKRTILIH